MRRLLIILSLGINPSLTIGQETDSSPLHQFDIHGSLGLGTKSHFGNFGLTGNFFLLKNFNLTLSAGVGVFNYNGALFSIGPEFCFVTSAATFVYLGSVWTTVGEGQDILGDDDSPDHVWYFTDKSEYIRTFLGIGIGKEGVTKIEIGYSYSLKTPTYSFGGPGIATDKQINSIERGLKSGLLVSVTVGGIFNLRHRK